MKKLFFSLLIAVAGFSGLASLRAEDAPAAKADPTVEQRVADLEAYVNNVARGADAVDAKVKSNVGGAGPGHNAFQMVCAALVLFMTLPGLFLFYGGLVRKKNVLSVVAQCFGIAGLVTIMWWAFGYSFVFGDGKIFISPVEEAIRIRTEEKGEAAV